MLRGRKRQKAPEPVPAPESAETPEAAETAEPVETGSRSVASLLKNWPVLAGVFSVGFVAARLLGASAHDPETAYAILQIQGTGNVIAGSLISGFGLIAAPLAVISFCAYKIRRDPNKASLAWLAGIFGFIIVAYTAPFGIFTALVALTAVFSFALWLIRIMFCYIARRKNKDSPPRARLSVYEMTAIYLGLTLLFFTVARLPPWLPAENIIWKGSTLTVYVLSQDPAITYILQENPVRIGRLPTSEVTSQWYCSTPGYVFGDEPLVQLLRRIGFLNPGDAPIYPRCLDIELPFGTSPG